MSSKSKQQKERQKTSSENDKHAEQRGPQTLLLGAPRAPQAAAAAATAAVAVAVAAAAAASGVSSLLSLGLNFCL